ncbi:MAG: hypothetical protein V1745_04915 [Patescibacteria group bacterium]
MNGNRNVAYLWNDDNGRNLNLDWIDNDWNDNDRFLAVRKSLHALRMPSSVGWGLFRLQMLLPAADVFPDVVQGNGESGEFFLVQTSHFPCDLKEEFEEVEFRGSSRDERGFLISPRIAGQQEQLNQVSRKRVNLHAEGESGCPRKSGIMRVPDFIEVAGFLQNGDI